MYMTVCCRIKYSDKHDCTREECANRLNMVDMKQPITKKIYIKNKIRYQDTESVVCK